MDDDLQGWCERAKALGADDVIPIAPVQVVTADWVRMKCRFGCDGFGECRTCPPDSPTPRETRGLLDEYRRALLLCRGPNTGYDESDDHHLALRRAATDLERELFFAGYYKAWAMPSGPCEECEDCDTSVPCIHPERARPSMESCGVDVFQTVRNVGWEIEVVTSREDPYRFFALVLLD